MADRSSQGTEQKLQACDPWLWAETLSAPPVFDGSLRSPIPLLVRRWRGIDPRMSHGALDRHFLSIHLGGDKRLTRIGEGATQTCEAGVGAFSIVPAGAAFRWRTEGPVDFMHVYFEQASLDRIVEQAFGQAPSKVSLHESLAARDLLVTPLCLEIADMIASAHRSTTYIRDLTNLLLYRILKTSSDAGQTAERLALTPSQVRRATAWVDQNYVQPIGIADMAAAAGVSPSHFSRGFKSATGLTPYAYILDRRIERAKVLLADAGMTLPAIAAACGFSSHSHLTRVFRKRAGVSPSEWRR